MAGPELARSEADGRLKAAQALKANKPATKTPKARVLAMEARALFRASTDDLKFSLNLISRPKGALFQAFFLALWPGAQI